MPADPREFKIGFIGIVILVVGRREQRQRAVPADSR